MPKNFSGNFVQTHGGWPGHVMKDMKMAAKGGVVDETYAVQFDSTGGDQLVTDENEIRAWARGLKTRA